MAMRMKNKGLKCKVDGCDRDAWGLGFCNMHYSRFRKHGEEGMARPIRKWSPDDPRYRNKNRPCSVEGCENLFYAKGLCRNHHEMLLRRGTTTYARNMPKKQCVVSGCEKEAGRLGYCKFHLSRTRSGTALTRPKGVAGELNHNWKGGIAQYPNHSEMKRMRKQALEDANYICQMCGGEAKLVHHKDNSKDNHSKDNLIPMCYKCHRQLHAKLRGGRNSNTIYRRAYGMSLKEVAEKMKISYVKASQLHRSGQLNRLLMADEVRAVLF